MNYIELINSFWRFYDENKDKISPSDIVLYKVLLRYCNKIGWINPFTINPFLMSEINPLSVNTYYKSFKNLNDIGLIKWTKGKHNVSNQQVTILKINNSVDTSLNNSVDTSIVNSLGNSVVNNNKTIILLDYYTIKHLEKKDFDFLIKSDEFKEYLKNENLEIKKVDEKKFNFKKSFLELGVNEEILNDWMEVRKKKKASNTKTAYTKFIKQVNLSGLTVNKCVQICAEKDWKGFEAEWLNNLNYKSNGNSKTQPATTIEDLIEINKKHFG